jgi:hypothetical protein
LQLCHDICNGTVGRKEAGRKYSLSANLLLCGSRSLIAANSPPRKLRRAWYEAKIAAFERKVGQLTMELDLVKKTPRPRAVADSEPSSIISGPKPAPFAEGAT